jgi:hypothetical protein
MARFPEIDAPEDYLAVGDASDVIARIGDYRAAGVSKFVARPIASSGAEVIAQTERLIAEVIPAIHGAPQAAKAATS